jgi:hypothetical protein
MHKSLVALLIFSTMSVSAAAQTAPAPNPAQPPKPQVVKQRVCQMIEDEDSYSRLGTRKICKTVEVPAPAGATADPKEAPAPAQQPNPGSR